MVSPLRSSCGDGSGGASSCTCWLPSRLVWPILASVFDRQLEVGLQIERQRRDPVLQLDLAHPADKHVGHPDAAVDVERQRIRHLHVDRHLVRSGAGTTRQRHVRDALPRPARAQHQRRQCTSAQRARLRDSAPPTASRMLIHLPQRVAPGPPARVRPGAAGAGTGPAAQRTRVARYHARCGTRRRSRLRIPRRRQRVVLAVGVRRAGQVASRRCPERGRRRRDRRVGSTHQLGEATPGSACSR